MLLLLLSPLSAGGEDFMAAADAVSSETTMAAVGDSCSCVLGCVREKVDRSATPPPSSRITIAFRRQSRTDNGQLCSSICKYYM